MTGRQGIGGSPFVSQVALHLLAFGQSQIAVENENLGNISLEEIALRKIFRPNLTLMIVLLASKNLKIFAETVHAARKKIKFARTENTGGLSTGLRIEAPSRWATTKALTSPPKLWMAEVT